MTPTYGLDWTHWGGDPAHTGTALNAPADLGHIAWNAVPETAPGELEEFVARGGVVVSDEKVFITGRHYADDGTGLWDHTFNIVIAYDAETGERLWDTEVDADSYEYDSWATPAVDVVNGTVIVASHFTVYALAITNGDIAWERDLPQVLVNASPTVTSGLEVDGVAANRVFITDYTGFATSGGGVYAINVSPYEETSNPYQPGDIVWQDRTLPGTSGNTVAYSDGHVYVGSTHGGVIRSYDAVDGGTPGVTGEPRWEADTKIDQLSQYAGFYGGVVIRNQHVYAAAYNFYGTGNTSRLYKLAADDGKIIWEQPCERTDSIPVVTEDGRIFLSAGIEGFGSAVKIQAFQDHGDYAAQLWDTHVATGGSLNIGGWTHQPLFSDGLLYCGTPDESQFFAPYTDLYILDVSYEPGDAGFIVDHVTGGGGSPAATGRYLYSLGNSGLVAFRGCGEGDMDIDGDVDLEDYFIWTECLSGPGQITPPGGCEYSDFACADLDFDGDVDLVDYSVFQHALVQDD